MVSNRMNRDEFYAAVALADEARLRKILWTLYWRGDARLRERIQDELRPPGQPKVVRTVSFGIWPQFRESPGCV
jgi:hypothetical protein